jgi:hypothetical protein
MKSLKYEKINQRGNLNYKLAQQNERYKERREKERMEMINESKAPINVRY